MRLIRSLKLVPLLMVLLGTGAWPSAQRHQPGSVTPRGERVLGIEVNQPTGFDHGVELARAQAVGASLTSLTLPWSVLEPQPGQFDFALLDLGLGFYRSQGVGVLLSVPVLDTIEALLPPDLDAAVESGAMGLADPRVRFRLQALLRGILARAGPELVYLCLANEVDVCLANRPVAWWTELRWLLTSGIAVVRTMRPDVRVGLSATIGGVADARLVQLTANHDVRFATYYAAGNLGGSACGRVELDLQRMLAYAGPKPLVLKECGYATGAALATEAGQARFVRALFDAWDQHADAVPCIVLARMFDGVPAECEAQAAYYGLPDDPEFIAFLCTLGLRREDGRAKPAWRELAFQTEMRGF